MKTKLTLTVIYLTLFGFVILWAIVSDAWGYSESYFQFNYGKLIYAVLSRFIWALPAVFLINKFNRWLYITKSKLFTRPVLNKSLLIFVLFSTVFILAAMGIAHSGIWINTEADFFTEIIKCFCISLAEEIVFRGWGYNALMSIVSDSKAKLISTVFFVMLHWPAYFIHLFLTGSLDYINMVTQSISVFIMGLFFCWLLKKSKTLWNPVIAHFLYDLAATTLVG